MRVLVTGGEGFIGRYIVNKLIEDSQDITVVDSNLRGSGHRVASLDHLKIIHSDLRNLGILDEIVSESDIVYHLAAVSRVLPSIESPLETFEINVSVTERIARACSIYGTKLIFSSSREVYGEPKTMPVNESHPIDPESPYGASKAAAEHIITSYGKTYGLNYVILRLANVFGNGDFERVIPIFMDKMSRNEEVTIFGRDKVIDFIDVDTVADIFVRSMELKNDVFNVSSGAGTPLTELAYGLKAIMKSDSKIRIMPNRDNEVAKFIGDPSKLKKAMGISIPTDVLGYIRDRML